MDIEAFANRFKFDMIDNRVFEDMTEEDFTKARYSRKPDQRIFIFVDFDSGSLTYDNSKRMALDIVEQHICAFFLSMNLACPGSLDFEYSALTQDVNQGIRLSALLLAHVWSDSNQLNWPNLTPISLGIATIWIDNVLNFPNQVAETTTQRAIFALLYYSSQRNVDPQRIIWLSHALESLFDTPHEAVSKALLSRIYLLIGYPNANSRIISRKIKEFYELRSRFVHGDYAIVHPSGNGSLDIRAENTMTELMDQESTGLLVLMAAIQEMARRNWTELKFEEVVSGNTNIKNIAV